MLINLDPNKDALFLDFDGTLVDIAPTPTTIDVPERLPDLLQRIARRFGGAVAVVSGRPIAELDRFLDPARLPAAGLHGLEWRVGDRVERTPPPASLEAVRRAVGLSGLVDEGLLVEDKGLTLALHYRAAPHLGGRVLDLAREATGPGTGLAVLDGKMVVEVKPAGVSKATAVRRLSALPPFAGRRPVFVGDDVTDEDGMRAAIEAGGAAVKVGEGDSVAPARLSSPAAVRAWLATMIGG